MSYYALTDSDWSWDDENEGRAIVVRADTPEEAVKIATEKHLKESPGAGGVTWKVSRLNLVGFQDAQWEDDNNPAYDGFTYYSAGINGAPDLPPAAAISSIESSAPVKGETEGWRPIETSPEDGSDILLADCRVRGGFMTVASYEIVDGSEWVWHTNDGPSYHTEAFTHWRPLPASPEQGAGQ